MPLGEQVAIVTGSAQGIGLAIARQLAEAGAHVILVDRQAETLAGVAREIARVGSAEAVPMDVADEESAVRLAQNACERFGRIDILVNNAGISPKRDGKRIPALQTGRADWDDVLAVNLTAPFTLCREIVPHMVRAGYGRVVNIASQAGRARPEFAAAPYAATKAGLIGFSRALAEEVARSGVTVNCVAPGRIETPLVAVAGKAANDAYAQRIPVGRLGTPDEIAAAVLFLAAPAASFVTGTTIDVNGGYVMA